MGSGIDKVREWWDAFPCNFGHSDWSPLTLHYSREVSTKKYKVEPHIPSFAEYDKWKNENVLDAGCGIGTMAIDFVKAGADVTAVDLSSVSIRVAARRALAEGVRSNYIRFICEDLERISRSPIINDRKYDLIFSFGVIHHTPDPAKALRELRKLIRGIGELRIMLYHKWSTKAIWLMLTGGWPFRSAQKCIERQSEANANCPVAYSYSKRQAKKLLQENGWEPISIHVDHIFPYKIAPYKQGEYKKKWYWRLVPRFAFRLLERTFGWHLLIKAVPK